MGKVIQYPSGIYSTERQTFIATAGQSDFIITDFIPTANIKIYIDGILTTFGWTIDLYTYIITFTPARSVGEEIVITN
jgi:hypothetical protein